MRWRGECKGRRGHGASDRRGKGRKEDETHLVQSPSIPVVENFHALCEDLLGLLSSERVLSAFHGFSEQRLSAVRDERNEDGEVSGRNIECMDSRDVTKGMVVVEKNVERWIKATKR